MQLKNRIKQEAEINEFGIIVFGAALPGFVAVDLETGMSDSFEYLLEDGSGGHELGVFEQQWDGSDMTYYRMVTDSNMNSGSGFSNSTTGLTLSIVGTATMALAHSGGSLGPRSAGTNAMALGPNAEALHSFSMAVGASARTKFPYEMAYGRSQDSYPSWVPVSMVAGSESTEPLACADDSTLLFESAMLDQSGVLRVTGSLFASRTNPETLSSTQVYDVSALFTNIGGSMTVLGTPAFTPLVTGSGGSGLSFSVSAGQIQVENTAMFNYLVRGLLHLQWLSADGQWEE